MDLAALSIKRPIFITCVGTLILLVGYICLKRLPVDLFPDVTFPTVVVSVPYRGAGPTEVETLVAKVLEEELSGIGGIEKLRSTSKEGIATIVAEFSLSVDIKYAEQQVRDRVSSARHRLPDDIDEPVIRTVDPSDQPIAVVAVSASGATAGELYDLAEQQVKVRIGQVNQVGLVEVLGGRKREIQVQLDINKLSAYKISASQVAEALGRAGENVPAGKTWNQKSEASYRTLGEFRDLAMIPKAVARFTNDEHPLTIGALGTVVDTLEDEKSRTYIDGVPTLLLYVYRQSGANTIAVVDRVKETVEKMNAQMNAAGRNVNIQVVRDGAKRIRDNVYDVNEAIIIGIFLTVIVVYLFLGSFRSTIITGMALPNSLLGAFILMLVAGFSINIMSLLALSLAVGLLIDDAIVVRENIFRHLEMGKDPEQAALDGTREVNLAVIATTLAVLAVFGPIGFLQGVTGQFFKEFGLTICFAMLISLFDALTIAPMLSAYFAGDQHAQPKTAFGRFNDRVLKAFDRFQCWLEDRYAGTLRLTLLWPKTVIAINVLLFAVSIFSVKYIPKTFIPAPDNGEFLVGLDLPPGTSLQRMAEVSLEVDKSVRSFKEVKRALVTVGNRDGEPNYAEIAVELHPTGSLRPMTTTQFKAIMRDRLKEFAYANPSVKDGDATGGGQRQFNLNLTGGDLKELEVFSQKLVERLKTHPALTDVDSNFRPGKPEFQFKIDPDIAREAGLSPRTVGTELRNLVEGQVAAPFRSGDLEYDIRVRLRDDQRDLKSDWRKILVPNINNTMVPLGLVAEMENSASPASIRRENRARTIQVSGDINPKGPGMGFAMKDVPRILRDEMKMPQGMSFAFSGQAERFSELMMNMVMAMGLGILFIYFVLASLYESFVTPLAIMLVLPLAAVGAFFALLTAQATLDLYSMIGCVMLMGLASKNSILLVDYVMQLMNEGVERREAVVRACRTRLRPILMTSLALIAGMVPVAIGLNEASKQRTSLGVAVIGGVVSSTLLTLVMVPAAFIYVDDFRRWTERIFNRFVRGRKKPVEAGAH
ncbi:MAG: efflux RND transporter permease subunit [Calothrix sp. SM1_5_4]|nr:efflux RND transporter permease subunit [Calothrix sp. SM1_5_4]